MAVNSVQAYAEWYEAPTRSRLDRLTFIEQSIRSGTRMLQALRQAAGLDVMLTVHRWHSYGSKEYTIDSAPVLVAFRLGL